MMSVPVTELEVDRIYAEFVADAWMALADSSRRDTKPSSDWS
jgi:hypothetical protein